MTMTITMTTQGRFIVTSLFLVLQNNWDPSIHNGIPGTTYYLLLVLGMTVLLLHQ